MYKYLIKEQINSETGKQEETLFAEDILEDKIIDKKVIAKIRKEYSIDEEIKALRKGILDKNNIDFQSYNSHVESCKTWGEEQKIKAGQERQVWKDNFRLRNESEKEYIGRLKVVLKSQEIISK